MNTPFWHNKRVFVTGHTGFKGGWLTVWLRRCGAQVTGFSLAPPSEPNLFELAKVDNKVTSVIADLRDRDTLLQALQESQAEIVFHLAAQSLVRRSYKEPLETYATNVLGTANLLEAIRSCPKVRAVVSVTSDKCYQNNEWNWGYREIDPLGGKDPYSSSKAAAELVTAAYRSSFFSGDSQTAVASARAGNVIGGGDWAEDRLVPDSIRAFLRGETVPIRSPQSTRPWQHVLEPLHGYVLLAEQLYEGDADAAGAWNFGPDARDERPVEWIVDRLADAWGENAGWRQDGGIHPPEATYLKLDSSKARRRLGWLPVLPLEEALVWVVEWHRAAERSEPMRHVTERQIEAYEDLLLQAS